jgi:hypothetical protein
LKVGISILLDRLPASVRWLSGFSDGSGPPGTPNKRDGVHSLE